MSETRILLATDLTFAQPNPLSFEFVRKGVVGLDKYAKSFGGDGACFIANRISLSGIQLHSGLLGRRARAALKDLKVTFRRVIVGVPIATLSQVVGSQPSNVKRGLTNLIDRTRAIVNS